jgi:transcriptional regulator with XRE-family HTH domain
LLLNSLVKALLIRKEPVVHFRGTYVAHFRCPVVAQAWEEVAGMGSLARWTGHEARALRQALRLSVRAFAERLGVGIRTVTKWESLGASTTPRPFIQSILDTALSTADMEARQRFELLLRQEGSPPVRDYYRHGPREWDYETWTDDLGRAAACLARQDFRFASSLVDRWLRRFTPPDLDHHGLYLHARSLVLLGDLQRDQGEIRGPLSARQTYLKAHQLFHQLTVPRRRAQVELSLAVVEEMSGRLEHAASSYELLADDERLSPRDRTRALLWVGTALSKKGHNTYAVVVMDQAIRRFEELEEPGDWSVAHQKLALAYRGAGDLSNASRYIDVALANRTADSPMQRVRLDTAHAHILLSDKTTSDSGLRLLEEAAGTSRQYRMSHQLASIEAIHSAFEHVN